MEEVRLGTLTNRKIGYGIVQPGASVPHGIPVIKVNNIISGLRNVRDLDTTSIGNDKKYSRTKLKGGELIVSVVGTIGRTAIVPLNFAGCNLVRATALIDIPDVQMSKWVKYYIDSPKGQNYIRKKLNTTVQPTLNVKSLVEMPIPVYSTQYMQKAIEILGNIDDKIEINRRINDNLEQQAQALFKSWFVDFEPFRDQPFVESELGMIPERWKVGTLGEIMNITSGKRPPKKETKPIEDFIVPLIGASGIMGYTNSVLFNEKILVIGRVGTHGVVQRFNTPCWPSDNTLVIKSCFYEYCYQILCSIDYTSLNRGSTQPLITQTDIKNQLIVIPPIEVINNFEVIVSTLMNLEIINVEESRRLAELRDTLLPRLMSGEIKVGDVTL